MPPYRVSLKLSGNWRHRFTRPQKKSKDRGDFHCHWLKHWPRRDYFACGSHGLWVARKSIRRHSFGLLRRSRVQTVPLVGAWQLAANTPFLGVICSFRPHAKFTVAIRMSEQRGSFAHLEMLWWSMM